MEANNLVLLVEDDHDIREVTLQVLQDLEYRPVAVENGQQALNMLRTMDEGYKVIALNGDKLNPLASFWQITLGNARRRIVERRRDCRDGVV